MEYYARAWLPARDVVKKSVSERFEVDRSGEIICLDQFCPWASHLYELGTSLNVLIVRKRIVDYTDKVCCVPRLSG